MKRIILSILLLACINLQAQQLSTATGRGRQIKNELLKSFDKGIFYRIIDYKIYDPSSSQTSYVIISFKGEKYTIKRQRDKIIITTQNGNVIKVSKAKVP